jgi:type I restriction enzyme M protein
VPEGIIFQSATAYKALRKLLIEDGLLAVVSLPAGVFNPYAGVKTSILLFDNALAKKTENILFLKISNDGYDLGAQRREIDKNDLPQALEIIKKYKVALKEGESFALDEAEKHIAHLVTKEKIAESDDYNLSGERYKEVVNFANQKWPMVDLGEVCEIFNGSRPRGGAINKGILSIGGEHINHDGSFNLEKKRYIPDDYFKKLKRGKLEFGDVLLVKDGATTGKVGYFNEKSPFKIAAVNEHIFILRADKNKIHPFYLFQFLKSIRGNNEILKHKVGAAQGGINLSIKKIKIPLPPLEVQKEIVEQIEVKQKAIDAAKAVIENLERERRYFGKSLRKLEGVEWVELGEVCIFEYGKPLKESDRKGGEYPVYGSNGIVGFHNEYLVKGPFIIVGRKGTAGAVVYSEKSGFPIDTTFYVNLKDQKVNLKFLYLIMTTLNLGKVNIQAGVPGLNRKDAYKVKIPLPSLEIQKQLVAEMEEQEKIIEANKKLIGIMEKKINEVLSEI